MKKLLYPALAAIAVLSASCTKNSIDKQDTSSSQAKINFTTVTGRNTKAPINGTTYKTTDPAFGVFCYVLPSGTWASSSASAQTYMDNVQICYVSADKIWEPANTYYWPLSGSLTFVGYSPFGCAGTVSYAPATKALKVQDFTVKASAAAQEDLMWATTNPDLTANQSTYTSELGTSDLRGVNEVFHHALSQVKFNVRKAAGLEDYTVTVNSITFDAHSKGTLIVTADSPAWSAQAKQTGFVYDTGGADVEAPDSSEEFAPFGSANMPVPQALSATVQTFDITYSLSKGSVDLGSKTLSGVDLLGTEVTEWLPNTIYNYNIVIDLEKIYFNPTVVEWTPDTPQEINVQ